MTTGWDQGGQPPSRGRSQPLGDGWWRASDGLYYPPELHPDYVARTPAVPPPTAPAPPTVSPPPAATAPWAQTPSAPAWSTPPPSAPPPPTSAPPPSPSPSAPWGAPGAPPVTPTTPPGSWGAPPAGPPLGPSGPLPFGQPPAAPYAPPTSPLFGQPGATPPWTSGVIPPTVPSRSKAPLFVFLALVLVGAVIAALAIVGSKSDSNTLASGSSKSSGSSASSIGSAHARVVRTGQSVFSDDFQDAGSGWATLVAPMGTKFGYQSGAYAITTVPHLSAFAKAPDNEPQAQIEVETTATISDGAPAGAGFGDSCIRTDDVGTDSSFRYDLMMFSDSRWILYRVTGSGTSAKAVRLREGTASVGAGTTPQKISISCSKTGNSKVVQIDGWVGGQQILESTDQPDGLPGTGWCGAVIVPSTDGSFTASFSHFEEFTVTTS